MRDKFNEVRTEYKTIFSKGNSPLDAVLLPIIFVLLSRSMPLLYASIIAVFLSLCATVYRIYYFRKFIYPLYGLGAVVLAIFFVFYIDSAEGWFYPLIIKDALIAFIGFVSISVKRPFVAYLSAIPRGWPLKWYWHNNVRPAYVEATLLWVAFFSVRAYIYWSLVTSMQIELLTTINIFFGWPGIFILFAVSYLYGSMRLKQLQGPSVDEFIHDNKPPFKSQATGF